MKDIWEKNEYFLVFATYGIVLNHFLKIMRVYLVSSRMKSRVNLENTVLVQKKTLVFEIGNKTKEEQKLTRITELTLENIIFGNIIDCLYFKLTGEK